MRMLVQTLPTRTSGPGSELPDEDRNSSLKHERLVQSATETSCLGPELPVWPTKTSGARLSAKN